MIKKLQLMGIKKWIKSLFSDDPSVSSKRVIGVIGLLTLIIIFTAKTLFYESDFNNNETLVFQWMLIIFGILVGGGTIENVVKWIKDIKIKKYGTKS